jgi:hypothetical protein
VPLLRKRQIARRNILCDRCGPGGWPGPQSFFWESSVAVAVASQFSALQSSVSLLRLPIHVAVKKLYHSFVFYSPRPKNGFTALRRPFALKNSRINEARLAAGSVKTTRMEARVNAFTWPRKFHCSKFSEALMHSSRMTRSNLIGTFVAPSSRY